MSGALHTVHLQGVPVRLWQLSADRYEDLVRELTLVEVGREQGLRAPRALLAVVDEARNRFPGLSDSLSGAREAALDAGRATVDLTLEVPQEVAPLAEAMIQHVAESDAICREGRYLLTLPAPPEVARYRIWFLSELVAQVAGAPPRPWTGPLDCADDG